MYRIRIFSVIIILLLSACSVTSAPVTPLPSSLPITQTPMAPPASQTEPFGQLEVISSQNWARLQLVQSFPAEMLRDQFRAAITPDEKTMVVGSSQRAQLFFLDLESGVISRLLEITGVKNVNARFDELKYLSDGSIMASSSGPYMIYRIDSSTGNILSEWEGINFAISTDEQIMATDAVGGTLLINFFNNTPIALLENTNGLGFSFSPDNSKIAIRAVAVDTGSVDVWDLRNQMMIKSLPDLYSPSYSPNGKFLAAESVVDGSLNIFSPDGGVQITSIPNVVGYLISPDDSLIVYEIANGSSIAMNTTDWKSYEMNLQGSLVSFSPGGHLLVTRTGYGAILIWGIPKGTE